MFVVAGYEAESYLAIYYHGFLVPELCANRGYLQSILRAGGFCNLLV